MARHQNYSKRSRESRKARTDGVVEPDDYPECDECAAEPWPPAPADADPSSDQAP